MRLEGRKKGTLISVEAIQPLDAVVPMDLVEMTVIDGPGENDVVVVVLPIDTERDLMHWLVGREMARRFAVT